MSEIESKGEFMTHKERMRLLKQWQDQLIAVDNVRKDIDAIFGDCIESEFYSVISKMAGTYTKTLSALIGDTGEWLDWYWLENYMGKREMEAKASNWNKMRKIKNLNDLCKLIEADIPKTEDKGECNG